MYHSFLIHLFADGHLGCFQSLAIVNCAAMNIGVHRFFWGEGFSETTIKDTWTKPRGNVRAGEGGGFGCGGLEGWGENADNCN